MGFTGVRDCALVQVRWLRGRAQTAANHRECCLLATIVAPRGARVTDVMSPADACVDGAPDAWGRTGALPRLEGLHQSPTAHDPLTPSHVRGVRQGPRRCCSRRSAACSVRRRSSPFAAVPSALLYRLLYCSPASARVGRCSRPPRCEGTASGGSASGWLRPSAVAPSRPREKRPSTSYRPQRFKPCSRAGSVRALHRPGEFLRPFSSGSPGRAASIAQWRGHQEFCGFDFTRDGSR